jgi:hypothetical protein
VHLCRRSGRHALIACRAANYQQLVSNRCPWKPLIQPRAGDPGEDEGGPRSWNQERSRASRTAATHRTLALSSSLSQVDPRERSADHRAASRTRCPLPLREHFGNALGDLAPRGRVPQFLAERDHSGAAPPVQAAVEPIVTDEGDTVGPSRMRSEGPRSHLGRGARARRPRRQGSAASGQMRNLATQKTSFHAAAVIAALRRAHLSCAEPAHAPGPVLASFLLTPASKRKSRTGWAGDRSGTAAVFSDRVAWARSSSASSWRPMATLAGARLAFARPVRRPEAEAVPNLMRVVLVPKTSTFVQPGHRSCSRTNGAASRRGEVPVRPSNATPGNGAKRSRGVAAALATKGKCARALR